MSPLELTHEDGEVILSSIASSDNRRVPTGIHYSVLRMDSSLKEKVRVDTNHPALHLLNNYSALTSPEVINSCRESGSHLIIILPHNYHKIKPLDSYFANR